MGARENFTERAHGVLQWHELAFITSEDLGDLERLRHETLDLTGTFDLNVSMSFVVFIAGRISLTVSLSSSDNSSIPKIAMISWRDL